MVVFYSLLVVSSQQRVFSNCSEICHEAELLAGDCPPNAKPSASGRKNNLYSSAIETVQNAHNANMADAVKFLTSAVITPFWFWWVLLSSKETVGAGRRG